MRPINSRSISIAAAFALVTTTACSDGSSLTAPDATAEAAIGSAAFSTSLATNNTSRIVSQTTVGDTIVTVFVVGSASSASATFALGHNSQIVFPSAASSICDIATSSYGPATWDSACSPSRTSVQITAKTWINASGAAQSDFMPAMRFVPNAKSLVTLTLKDIPSSNLLTSTIGLLSAPKSRIDFVTAGGSMVNESLFDSKLMSTTSLITQTISTAANTLTGGLISTKSTVKVVTRPIKHFSGYTVTAD